jgi:hypothetical protein
MSESTPAPQVTMHPEPKARGLLFGCGFGIFGILYFAGLIAWTFWQANKSNEAVDAFTVANPVIQPVVKLPEAESLALDAKLHSFAGALDAGSRAETRLDAAALNHLIATDERLADLRGQLYINRIENGKVHCQICYPLNGLPWENRKRYMIGNLTLIPELKDGNPAFRVAALEVPGHTLPKGFTDQFSIYHMLEKYQKDETIRRRTLQLSALTGEGGEVVLRSKAWKESN